MIDDAEQKKRNRLIFLYEKKKMIEQRRPLTKHGKKCLDSTNNEIIQLEKELTL